MVKKLCLGIALGAVAGAAISLLDRQTREQTIQKATNIKTDVQYLYYSRDQVKENAKGKFSKVQGLIENVMENKDFYLEKIAELKETTPKLAQQFQQTKEAFSKESSEPKKPEDVIHL